MNRAVCTVDALIVRANNLRVSSAALLSTETGAVFLVFVLNMELRGKSLVCFLDACTSWFRHVFSAALSQDWKNIPVSEQRGWRRVGSLSFIVSTYFLVITVGWYFETGMLLKPTVPGLCAMLQTIYETESCFSSDTTSSREQPVELLPQSRSTSMPSTGEFKKG